VIGGNSRRYFAPESLRTPDGRRVNWSWFINGNGKDHRGTQSLPTEMSLDSNDRMCFRPIRELETLRYAEKEKTLIQMKKNSSKPIDEMKGDHCEIELFITNTGNHSFGIDILCNDEGQDGLRIKVNREKNLLEVGDQNGDFILKSGEPLSLRIFVDACLVEVFANEKQLVMADKKRPAGSKIKDRIALFSGESDLLIDRLSFWKMKSAYNE
jgi:beta-fructofuranosidase